MSTVILHLEDSDLDAELIAQRLSKAVAPADLVRARGRSEFLALITADRAFDVILSDYQLPDVDGLEALELSRTHRPDVPFIFVSGAIGEELAVDLLKRGATDYVLKHRLERLAPAIGRALAEARERTERQRAERAVRAANERLALAQSAGRSGVFDWLIPEGRVVWSPELEDLYGIPRGSFEQTYEAWERRVVPEDAAAVGALVRRCIDERAEIAEYEFRVVLPDGRRKWIAAKAQFLFGPLGVPMRMVGINIDIHERKEIEQRLRRSEEGLRLAHEAGTLGAWDLDPTTGHLTCSDVCKANFGLAPHAAPSYAALLAAIHPDDRTAVRARIERALATREDYDARYRVVGPDGALRWVHVRGRAVNGHDGTPPRMTGVSQDVSDQVRDEEAIRRQNEHLRLLADAAEALLAADGSPERMMRDLFARVAERLGLTHYFNYEPSEDGSELVLLSCAGVPAAEVAGIRRLTLGQAVCGTVALTRRPHVATAVQTSADPRVQLVKAYGIRAYACSPLLAGDRLLGTLSFATSTRDAFSDEDLNVLRTICHYVAMAKERHRLAAEAHDRAERLKAEDRRKDEFLALLAHELRNPLAPLRHGLEVIRLTGGAGAPAERARDMMGRQLAHMVRLIDDLLDVSRISQNKLHLQRTRLALADVMQSAVETARPLIDAAGHALTVALPRDPVFLDGDLTRLAQVFSNLLTNSAKYTPRGGRIALDAVVRPGALVVTVRDTGIGIPASYLPRIFDMFSQADRLVERATGGLGIGLALVKGLVEMHGGKVEARSDGPGTGSAFTVWLPLSGPEAPAGAVPAADGAVPAVRGPKRRVLVVDDNRDAAEALGLMLELLGNEVHSAHDGLEAVEAAERVRPELIFMDVGMPRLNGLDAAARIRERSWGRAPTIIALTGWGQDSDRDRSRAAGCNGHLVKPVTLADIERLIGEVSFQP
ncbi:response regulator [Frigoriglobus tundricola]|uniref:histidine kinase n=1 Tax=Frigoriglobus tundricola TaxID=2774151 RepID=A0A6M5YYD3_9BACT|nr:response regulator [Frigoriglobus tundricola]QJW98261.1 Sensor histidine kinase TmoS [Frigoriglobus tundricola]